MDDSIQKLIATRKNIDLLAREDQLEVNILGWHGGRPYVENRLSRFAGENKVQFSGGTREGDGSKITGRKDQTHVIPHLSRIVEKINQYVLKDVKRDGIDKDIQDKTGDNGDSIDNVMKEVNSYVTVTKWCWIGIDVPETLDEQISIEQKQASGIRPYWRVYSPLEVVDWYIDKSGTIQWLITEENEYMASDPLVAPEVIKVRRLWQPGQVTVLKFNSKNPEKVESVEVKSISVDEVPFVLVNTLDAEPFYFDDLESVNRTIMDLESCNRTNYFNSVYAQMYLPRSALDSMMENNAITAESAVTKLMGFNYPIFIGQGDQTPGYIIPDASAIGTIRTEIDSLKKELMDAVGLGLQKESRQVASAESKAWDHLDLEQVMKDRAKILEDAENKAIAISNKWDPDFIMYTATYPTKFDLTSFKEDMDALLSVGNISMPKEMNQYVLGKIFDQVKKEYDITPEQDAKITEAIKVFGDDSSVIGEEVMAQIGMDEEEVPTK